MGFVQLVAELLGQQIQRSTAASSTDAVLDIVKLIIMWVLTTVRDIRKISLPQEGGVCRGGRGRGEGININVIICVIVTTTTTTTIDNDNDNDNNIGREAGFHVNVSL